MLLLAHLRERHVQGCVIRFNVSKVWRRNSQPPCAMNLLPNRRDLLFQLPVWTLTVRAVIAVPTHVVTAWHVSPRGGPTLFMLNPHNQTVLLMIPTGINVRWKSCIQIASHVSVIFRNSVFNYWSKSFSSPDWTHARVIARRRE